MRLVELLLLSAISSFGQGALTVGLRNPGTLMAMTRLLYPTQVANCTLWISADFGVYKDAGVTLSGDTDQVAQWNDKSGNSSPLISDEFMGKPKLRTSQINGLPAVAFGNDTYNRLTNLFSTFTNDPTTVFAVFYPSNAMNAALHGGLNGSGPCTVWTLGYPQATDQGGNNVSAFKLTALGQWYEITTVQWTNESIIMGFSKQEGRGTLKKTARNGMYVGGSGAGGSLAKGMLAELIVFQGRILNYSEIYGVEMYLKRKYCLAQPF